MTDADGTLALATTSEPGEPPRFCVLVGLVLAQLLLGRRHLLGLGAKHATGQRLHRGGERGELAFELVDLRGLHLELADAAPKTLCLCTPDAAVVVGWADLLVARGHPLL